MVRRHRVKVLVGALVAALVNNGCGYALAGQGSFLPDYIQTIGIPLFENTTTVFEVEQALTQQVVTQFIGRGSYNVSSAETGVDALLSGTITSIDIQPASFTAQQQASRYVFTLRVAIEFRDLATGEMLWENPALTFSDEYEVASGSGGQLDANTFFGQQSNAVERLARDFGLTVVSSILEAF
ncbi:MAG: LptE family protein [Acidobacteria bacterium]|nr:LptE family protein [Acidobacteriota bacterium]